MNISQAILAWYDQNGRKALPWRQDITPYKVWLSEVMLQQTQVQTVVPYFQKFITTFPTVADLAAASQDQVFSLWAGLGYYARARNLHRCAQIVVEKYQGQFPQNLDELQALPGIGRSTAGAIAAIAFNMQAPILDGNVKRILTRINALTEPLNSSKLIKQLWEISDKCLPKTRVADYTQAIMDLGATLCTRSQPKCPQCPIKNLCLALKQDMTHLLPTPAQKKQSPVKTTLMLLITNTKGDILLEKRPAVGIWGGLWSLPECADQDEIESFCLNRYGLQVELENIWPNIKHVFTHFQLQITPVKLRITKTISVSMESQQQIWYNPQQPLEKGVAAPIKRILQQLGENS